MQGACAFAAATKLTSAPQKLMRMRCCQGCPTVLHEKQAPPGPAVQKKLIMYLSREMPPKTRRQPSKSWKRSQEARIHEQHENHRGRTAFPALLDVLTNVRCGGRHLDLSRDVSSRFLFSRRSLRSLPPLMNTCKTSLTGGAFSTHRSGPWSHPGEHASADNNVFPVNNESIGTIGRREPTPR